MSEMSFFDDLGETLADVEEVRYAGFITEPGIYAAKLTEIEEAFKNDDPQQPQLILIYEITEGPHAGSTVRDYFSYTRNQNDPNFQRQLGFIKARFVDLGLPADHKGRIDKDAFKGVEVLLTMVQARPSKKNPGSDSHINKNTGKPHVNISEVTRRDKVAAAPAPGSAPAPTIPSTPSTSFFN